MTNAESREVADQGGGIGKGEMLLELKAQRCARYTHCESRRARGPSRARICVDARIVRASPAYRRRQLGCSSTVPGRLGCWSTASTSSSGISTRSLGVCATNFTAASATAAPSLSAGGSPAAALARRNARHSVLRSSRLSARSSSAFESRADFCSRHNVVPAPPSGYRRQIVRRSHCRRRFRPALRRPELAALTLEP